MKDILIRGLVIALLTTILGDLSDILFAQRTEPCLISKDEMSQYEKLTLKEAQ